jgi:hypothetical protein
MALIYRTTFLITLLLIPAWLSAADDACSCDQVLSVLYYPQFPTRPSCAHIKLRAGDRVVSAQHDWRTYDGLVKLAQRQRRKAFVEFPISYDPIAIRYCRREFEHGPNCALQAMRPLEKLGLISRLSLLAPLPIIFASTLFLKSLRLGPEYKPRVVGNPRLILSEGQLFDIATLAFAISPALLPYAIEHIVHAKGIKGMFLGWELSAGMSAAFFESMYALHKAQIYAKKFKETAKTKFHFNTDL